MHLIVKHLTAISIALIIFCHVSVLAAPAEPDLDSPERPAQEKEGEEDEAEYEEYEDEEGSDEQSEPPGGMQTIAKIKVTWGVDENDLYVDNPLQTARMWGILPGNEGEDHILIKEDDDGSPRDATMLIPSFPQQLGDNMPNPDLPPGVRDQIMMQQDSRQREENCDMYNNLFMLRYMAAASQNEIESMRDTSSVVREMLKSALFGPRAYDETSEGLENSTPLAKKLTLPPQNGPKQMWALGSEDLEENTTPDYNRLVMMKAFGHLL